MGSEPTGPTSAVLVRAQPCDKKRLAFTRPWSLHIQPPANKNNQYITFIKSVSLTYIVGMCRSYVDAGDGDKNRVEK